MRAELRIGWLGALAGAALALASPGFASAAASTPRQIAADLSAERHFAGIPPVQSSPALSVGCAAHNRYLELNPGTRNPHTERPGRPGYSAAGARAARQSVLGSLTTGGGSAWPRSDPFDPAPYHLLELMSPALRTVGANELITRSGLAYECVNVLGGRPRPAPRRLKVYEFPGRSPVPHFYSYAEGPHAGGSGVWLFVYLFGPPGQHVVLTKLRFGKLGQRPIKPLASFTAGGLQVRGRSARGRTFHCPAGYSSSPQGCVPVSVNSNGFYSTIPSAGILLPVLRPGHYPLQVGAEPGTVTFTTSTGVF